MAARAAGAGAWPGLMRPEAALAPGSGALVEAGGAVANDVGLLSPAEDLAPSSGAAVETSDWGVHDVGLVSLGESFAPGSGAAVETSEGGGNDVAFSLMLEADADDDAFWWAQGVGPSLLGDGPPLLVSGSGGAGGQGQLGAGGQDWAGPQSLADVAWPYGPGAGACISPAIPGAGEAAEPSVERRNNGWEATGAQGSGLGGTAIAGAGRLAPEELGGGQAELAGDQTAELDVWLNEWAAPAESPRQEGSQSGSQSQGQHSDPARGEQLRLYPDLPGSVAQNASPTSGAALCMADAVGSLRNVRSSGVDEGQARASLTAAAWASPPDEQPSKRTKLGTGSAAMTSVVPQQSLPHATTALEEKPAGTIISGALAMAPFRDGESDCNAGEGESSGDRTGHQHDGRREDGVQPTHAKKGRDWLAMRLAGVLGESFEEDRKARHWASAVPAGTAGTLGGPHSAGAGSVDAGQQDDRAPGGNGPGPGLGPARAAEGGGGTKGKDKGSSSEGGALVPSFGSGSKGGSQEGLSVELTSLGGLGRDLMQLAEAVATQEQEGTDGLWRKVRRAVDPRGTPAQRVGFYFLEGLRARIQGTGYALLQTPVTTTLHDFAASMKALFSALPHHTFFTNTANAVFLEAMGQATERTFHILDLGWWLGMQWPTLIASLRSALPGAPPPHIRFTKVDFITEDPARLLPRLGTDEYQRALHQAAARAGVRLDFDSLEIRVDEITPERLRLREGEAVFVQGLMRLNRLSDASVVRSSPRDAALRALRALEPRVLLVGERNVDHNMPFFLRRTTDALAFYCNVFESLDAGLARDNPARLLFERALLGRDIVNVVACEGTQRVCRAEPLHKWRSRMKAAGFVGLPVSRRVKQQLWTWLEGFSPEFGIADDENGGLFLTWKGRQLLSFAAFRGAC